MGEGFNVAPLKVTGGECYYHPGDSSKGVVSAPHYPFDDRTKEIVQMLSQIDPDRPVVYCSGYRGDPGPNGSKIYDVNRPTHQVGKPFRGAIRFSSSIKYYLLDIKASLIFFKYFVSELLAAKRLPRVVHEIHGKAANIYLNPVTELRFVNVNLKPKQVEEIKQIWLGLTGEAPLVWGYDDKANFSHKEYMNEGLAYYLGYHGVNVELSAELRFQFESSLGAVAPEDSLREAPENAERLRIATIKALSKVIDYTENVIREQK